MDVDILGYTHDDSDNNESNASSVLLPVATLDEVELAIGRVLPVSILMPSSCTLSRNARAGYDGSTSGPSAMAGTTAP